MNKNIIKIILIIMLITLCGCARNNGESASVGLKSDSEVDESSSMESEDPFLPVTFHSSSYMMPLI